MTMYEVLKLNRGLLEVLEENGMHRGDVKHVQMYEEYMRMVKEGHKMVYIVAFLCDEYSVSEATVYRVVKRFRRKIAM